MPTISQRERNEVKSWFAKMDAAKKIFQPLRTEYRIYQDALANKFPMLIPGNIDDPMVDGGVTGNQVNVNLAARVVAYIKSKCHDNSPEIRVSGMRDEDMQLAALNEHLLSRVMERGGAPQASRTAIDDMATLGPWIVWFGLDSTTIDHRRLAGFATDPGDLVVAAAQGAEDVHPLPGMDLLQLAQMARNLHANSTWTLTDFQLENLLRLATEAEEMYRKEQETPQTLTPRRFWYRASAYGTGTLIDGTVFDRADAKWMARRIVFAPEQFKAWEPFSRTARKNAKPTVLTKDSGHEWIQIDTEIDPDANAVYVVWEIWDRLTQQVHYVTEGYDGYLEEDSTYPYFGPDGLPIFDDFFPCEWCVPYTHNIEKPSRVTGVPLLAFSFPQQIEVIKFESAIISDAKRSARIFEVSPGMNEDVRMALQVGADGTIIERSEVDQQKGLPSVSLLPNVPMGNDKLIARKMATEDFYAMSSVSPSQITGEPVAQTLGQEQLVTRGAGDVQGDIISMIEYAYSNLARKTAAVIRTHFRPEEVMRYLDRKYISPLIDKNTNQVVKPSPFEEWKAESLDGVDILASFSTKGASDDLQEIDMLMRALQLTLTARDSTGLPLKDTRPLLDLLFQRMALGVVPDYQASQNELGILAIKQFLAEQQNKMQQGQGQQPQPPAQRPSQPRGGQASLSKAVKKNRQVPNDVSGPNIQDRTGGANPPRQD